MSADHSGNGRTAENGVHHSTRDPGRHNPFRNRKPSQQSGNPPESSRDQEKMERGEQARGNNGPRVNENGHVVTKHIAPDGESGRSWAHPWHFLRICWRSSSKVSQCTNVLWPFTIAALVLYFNYNNPNNESNYHPLWIFVCSYIGMVPAANLLGFAGQELARKMPKVAGIILETTFGSVVEIVLFMVLIKGPTTNIAVIKAAILGSILANMLLCLGACFFVGGIFRVQQTFHEAVAEVGSNLMLVAAFGLIVPSIYYNSLWSSTKPDAQGHILVQEKRLMSETERISHAAAIVLFIAFLLYTWFQASSHTETYEDILEADEERDHDRHIDIAKDKLTLTEAILAVAVAIMFVAFMAIALVEKIPYMVEERNISDHFMGLILIPVVEKASEHLTAVDEAWDDQMNFALSHVLGASIQTALLNTPLVVFVGWGLGTSMDLNFALFDSVVLILAVIAVGNFLRDEKSDYLEGALCVFVYILIAITAWYYPNPIEGEQNGTAKM